MRGAVRGGPRGACQLTLVFASAPQRRAPLAAPVHSQNDSEDLSPELLPKLSEFDSAVDIDEFLNRLLVLVTKGRVSPRRAAVLAYITNQLLHSHRAIEREHNAQANVPQQIILEMPGPKRD